MKRFTVLRTATACGLALGMAVAGCKKPETAEATEASGKVRLEGLPKVQVATAAVESGEVSRTLDLTATLMADSTSNVAGQAPGVVAEAPVDVGDNVKKGDTLVRLDDRDARMRVQSAVAAVMQARARLGLPLEGEVATREGGSTPALDVETLPEVRTAKAGLVLAQSDHERNKKLAADGAVSASVLEGSGSRLEQAQGQLDITRNGIQQALAGLVAAEAQLSMARKALQDMVVRAPFNGAVVRRNVNVGEYALPQQPLLSMVATEKLRLVLDVPESAVTQLLPGMDVTFNVVGRPDAFSGKVSRIAPSLDPNTRALRAEALVDNKDGKLKAGMFVAAHVVLAGREVALFVPRAAVLSQSGVSKVFVVNGDHVEERIVTLGERRQDSVEIRGEVKAGDKVVTKNVDKLTDGAPVEG